MAREVKISTPRMWRLPPAAPDTGSPGQYTGSFRCTPYIEPYILNTVPTKHTICDEGRHFTVTNPTPNTAVTYAIQSAFSNTVGLFVIKNDSPISPDSVNSRVYLDSIRLRRASTSTAGTNMRFLVKLDTVNRTPTANSTVRTPVYSDNMDSAESGRAKVWAFSGGGLTIPASGTNARTLAPTSLPGISTIANATFTVTYGGVKAQPMQGLTAIDVAAVWSSHSSCPPVIVGPQQWAVIHMWWEGLTTTAPQFEYELSWWER